MAITPEVAFLIAGQGTPHAEIHAYYQSLQKADRVALEDRVQIAQEQYETVSSELGQPVDFNLAEELGKEEISPYFERTDFVQMAMGIVDSLAVDMALQKAKAPLLVAGHRYGEVVGGYMIGIIPKVEDLLRFSAARGILMQRFCGDSALYIVRGLEMPQIQKVIDETEAQRGLLNAPKLFLLGDQIGRAEKLQAAAQKIDPAATVTHFEYAAGAFHTRYFVGAFNEMSAFVSQDIRTGKVTFQDAQDGNQQVMNYEGRLIKDRFDFTTYHLISFVTFVNWVGALKNLQEAGASNFVVLGPPRTLQGINGLNGLGRNTIDLAKYLA